MVSSMHVPIERKMKENLTWNISVYYSFLFHYYCIFFNLKHWKMLCWNKTSLLLFRCSCSTCYWSIFIWNFWLKWKKNKFHYHLSGSAVLSTFCKWHWFDEISPVKIFTSLIQRTFTEWNRINYQSIYTMMKFREKQHPNAYVENYMKFNSI